MPETRDLLLKKAVFEDWPDIYSNLWRHAESARFMLWDVTESEEAAQERMRRTLAWQAAHEQQFLVYEKSTGKAIGFAGMLEIEPGVWDETGVALGPDYVGRGYGGQILDLLTETAFSLGGREFQASCRSENERSRRLILSRGFVPTGEDLRLDPRSGEEYTLLLFSLHPSEDGAPRQQESLQNSPSQRKDETP